MTRSLIVVGTLVSYFFVYPVIYIYLDEYEGKGGVPVLPGWVWDFLDWSVEPLSWLDANTEIYGEILERILNIIP